MFYLNLVSVPGALVVMHFKITSNDWLAKAERKSNHSDSDYSHWKYGRICHCEHVKSEIIVTAREGRQKFCATQGPK